MKMTLKLLTAATILGASSLSMAAVTGKVDVKLKIDTGCTVEGISDNSSSMSNFGELDFGKNASTWTNYLNAELAGPVEGSSVKVKCSDTEDVQFKVAVDGGVRANRTLKHTTGEDTVAYEVYGDRLRDTSSKYAINVGKEFTAVAGQGADVQLYGAIAPNATSKAKGDYTDTLLVSITF